MAHIHREYETYWQLVKAWRAAIAPADKNKAAAALMTYQATAPMDVKKRITKLIQDHRNQKYVKERSAGITTTGAANRTPPDPPRTA